VCRAKLLLPLGIVLVDTQRAPRRNWDTERLCPDSAHMPGLKDMVAGVTSVCFSLSFGRLVWLQAVGTAVFLCSGDQQGLVKGEEDFLG